MEYVFVLPTSPRIDRRQGLGGSGVIALVVSGPVPILRSLSEARFSGMGLTHTIFLVKQGHTSKMKTITERIRPKPSTKMDVRTCCIVSGLFPYSFFFVQNAK